MNDDRFDCLARDEYARLKDCVAFTINPSIVSRKHSNQYAVTYKLTDGSKLRLYKDMSLTWANKKGEWMAIRKNPSRIPCKLMQIPIEIIEEDQANNFRKDLGDLRELQTSIRKFGMMNPLLGYYNEHQTKVLLMCGFRRFAAVKNIAAIYGSQQTVPMMVYQYKPGAEEQL